MLNSVQFSAGLFQIIMDDLVDFIGISSMIKWLISWISWYSAFGYIFLKSRTYSGGVLFSVPYVFFSALTRFEVILPENGQECLISS